MTATEKARRAEALFNDRTKRELADMVVHREADLEDARAENAKLRDGANAMRQLYEDELKHALAENDKLRELVRDLHMAYIGIIDQCESFDTALTWEFSGDVDADLAKQHASYEQDRHRFDVAMRELGVEVNDG